MNKLSAAIGAALVAGLVLVPAAAASAHHATITHTVTCDTTTWTWTVVVNVANSESDKVMTITNSDQAIVPIGDTVDKGATKPYTLTGVTAPADEAININVSWPNGVTASASDSITVAEFPACVAPTPTPTPTPSVTPPVTPPAPPVKPSLPVTGGEPSWWLLGPAAGVVLLGAALIRLRARNGAHRI